MFTLCRVHTAFVVALSLVGAAGCEPGVNAEVEGQPARVVEEKSGTVKIYRGNKAVAAQLWFAGQLDGKRHPVGPWVMRHPNGAVASSGTFPPGWNPIATERGQALPTEFACADESGNALPATKTQREPAMNAFQPPSDVIVALCPLPAPIRFYWSSGDVLQAGLDAP